MNRRGFLGSLAALVAAVKLKIKAAPTTPTEPPLPDVWRGGTLFFQGRPVDFSYYNMPSATPGVSEAEYEWYQEPEIGNLEDWEGDEDIDTN